jgi:hypothetical protein
MFAQPTNAKNQHTALNRVELTVLESRLQEIIQRACDIQSDNRRLHQKIIPEIISRWTTLKADQDKKNKDCGHLFNPLAFIPIAEPTHSQLLGDLLDPKGSHGQGRLFLEAFLEHIDVPNPKDGDWMVSVEAGRVDIRVWRRSPPSMILIENKSNGAIDQSNQLYRYWYENIKKPHPDLDHSKLEIKRAFQVIYLPPYAGKQPEQHSLSCPECLDGLGLPKTLHDADVTVKLLTFRDDISAWLDGCKKLIPPTNTRLKTYLQFYTELWS